jgi:hypothetical protein
MMKRYKTYEELADFFAKGRKPSQGRRLSSAFRIFKDTDKHGVVSYVVNMEGYGSKPFMRITPDNIVEFVATPEEVWHNSQSIVSSIHNWFPFDIARHKKGLYRVAHHAILMDKEYHYIFMRTQPAYYQGLKFNMITGECLNRRATDRFIEKPKERKIWRQTLARFKKGIKARAKVRALDPFVNEVWSARQESNGRYHWKQPDWSSESWIKLLEKSMKDNVFPRELLIGFCMTPHTGYYQQEIPTSNDVIKSVDKILGDLSIELRRRFNVFKSEGHDEKKQERYHYSWGDKNITLEEVSKR